MRWSCVGLSGCVLGSVLCVPLLCAAVYMFFCAVWLQCLLASLASCARHPRRCPRLLRRARMAQRQAAPRQTLRFKPPAVSFVITMPLLHEALQYLRPKQSSPSVPSTSTSQLHRPSAGPLTQARACVRPGLRKGGSCEGRGRSCPSPLRTPTPGRLIRAEHQQVVGWLS